MTAAPLRSSDTPKRSLPPPANESSAADMLDGVDALIPSERRIAGMAAEGMSNRDIAQSLFLSVKTVETHRGHAYGKLNITSRAKLIESLHDSALAEVAS